MTHLNADRKTPVIDISRCSGCGRCVAACLLRIITLETPLHRKYAIIILPERCTGCGNCITACPINAICQPSQQIQ